MVQTTTVADMEDVSEKSCQGFGIDRFLCGPHRKIQSAVRFGGPRSPPSQGGALQCHGASHRSVDRTADHRRTAPEYLLRDRDAVYGSQFQRRVKSLGIEVVLTAPRSPWQNAFVERVIGSIRRDCLDHVIVLNECHLKRILTSYLKYYHRWRTHLSLDMDSPQSRSVQPPALGKVVQFPEVGGLHHHYERLAA